MEIEQIREFLSVPQIADIIAYILIFIVFILQSFIKKFVRKDNNRTLFDIDTKTRKLGELKSELCRCTKKAEQERELYEQEKVRLESELADMKKELNTVKRAIRIGFSNIDNLVKNGVANRVAKILSVDKEEALTNLEHDDENQDAETE